MIDRVRNEPVMVLMLLAQVCNVIVDAVTDAGLSGTSAVQAVVVALFAWAARQKVTPV